CRQSGRTALQFWQAILPVATQRLRYGQSGWPPAIVAARVRLVRLPTFLPQYPRRTMFARLARCQANEKLFLLPPALLQRAVFLSDRKAGGSDHPGHSERKLLLQFSQAHRRYE